MAFASDIENALARICAETLFDSPYRFGDVSPSLLGPSVRLYRGWPIAAVLNADIQTPYDPASDAPSRAIAHVTIYTRPGITHQVERYLDHWRQGPEQTQTLFATLSGQILILSGVPNPNCVVGLTLAGHNISYRPTATDTLETIAQSLSALIPNSIPQGSTLQLPAVPNYLGVMPDDLVYRELRRQTQGFTISIWGPTPQIRDTLSATLDAALADVRCLALPDGSGTSPILSQGIAQTDAGGKSSVWRSDLLLSVNYATTKSEFQPRVMCGHSTVTNQ